MTVAYSAFVALLWCSSCLALFAGLAAVVLSAVWAADNDPALLVSVGGVAGALLLAWAILPYLHDVRVLIRSGSFPALCMGDETPTSEVALVAAADRMLQRTGRAPAIVGSGWGFYLQRRGPRAPRIFTHRMRGPAPDSKREALPREWLAGTPIAQVVKTLEAQGYTLPAHPTMDYITVGSWFAFGNHGNSALPEGANGAIFERARVVEMLPGSGSTIVTIEGYSELRSLFDTEASTHCVVSVTFKRDAFVRNIDVQQKAQFLDSATAAADWLTPTAKLRVCFLGRARPDAFAITWTACRSQSREGPGLRDEELGEDCDESLHGKRDPHGCSRWCKFVQVDVCSVVGGWYHAPFDAQWSGVATLADSNRWTPFIAPIENAVPVLLGIVNFELVFKPTKPLTGETLFKLLEALKKDVHGALGGRTELRYTDGTVYLDCSFAKRNFEVLAKALHDSPLKVREVALHPGKYQLTPKQLPRLKLVPLGAVA
jgi:hypothetical protein